MSVEVVGDASKKLVRVAAIGLDGAALALLTDCFQHFHIQTTDLDGDPVQKLQSEKFDACVLRLDERAAQFLNAARNSEPNRKMVVYGVCSSPQDARRYSQFGINAVVPESYLPDAHSASASGDRAGVMRVLENTHRLVINELRRHVRFPIVTDVAVESARVRFTAYSQEVSAGGISFIGAPQLAVGQKAVLTLQLPESQRITIRAEVSWFKPPDELGMTFEMDDPNREAVRRWVEEYLEAQP